MLQTETWRSPENSLNRICSIKALSHTFWIERSLESAGDVTGYPFSIPIHMLPISQRCLGQLLWLTNGSMDYLTAKQVCFSHKNERMNRQTALRLHWEESVWMTVYVCLKAKSYWVARKDEWRKTLRWEWNGEMGWMDGASRCFTWLMLSLTGCQPLLVPDAGFNGR